MNKRETFNKMTEIPQILPLNIIQPRKSYKTVLRNDQSGAIISKQTA